MPVYSPTIPTGLVNLSIDYQNLQNNFAALDQSFGVNHFLFSDNTSNNGKHTFIEMVDNGSIPGTTVEGEGTLYTITASSITDMYYTPDDSANPYQITNVGSSAQWSKFGASPNGWVFLPGGLILNYGASNSTSSGSITFARPFTTILDIWANPTYGGSSPNGEATVAIKQGDSSFTFAFVTSSGAYNGFYWTAIGYG